MISLKQFQKTGIVFSVRIAINTTVLKKKEIIFHISVINWKYKEVSRYIWNVNCSGMKQPEEGDAMYRQMTIWRWIWVVGILPGMLLPGGCTGRITMWAKKVTLQDIEMPTQCAGWEKLELKKRTRYYLVREDQRLLVNIDAHNLRGRNLGCWK